MAKKGTNAEVEERVNIVYMLILQSEPTAKIIQYCADKWGIARRQSEKYIQVATERMKAELSKKREDLLATAIAQRQDLYRRAIKKDKFYTCLEIARDRDNLLHLYDGLEDAIKIVERAGLRVVNPLTESSDDGAIDDFTASILSGSEAIPTASDSEDGI